jgi:hypothetical protein
VDPCVEVATLVVSYLWPLRELFPQATSVGDLKAGRDGRPLEDVIHEAVSRDFALLARLRNVSHRRANERWPAPTVEPKRPLRSRLTRKAESDSLGQMLAGIVAEQAKDAGDDWQKPSKRISRYFTEKATRSDCEKLSATALKDYLQHLTVLIEFFPQAKLRQDVGGRAPSPAVTREGLTEWIALDMLDRTILHLVAAFLEYRPILVRALDGDWELLADPKYPEEIIKQADLLNAAVPFPILMHRELEEIEALRRRRRGEEPLTTAPPAPTLATRRAFDQCLLGLALSGGGIRSATFSLGILQGLASRGWLRHIDYLSTVSGGGYIGAWLLSWIKRRGSVTAVEESLRGYYSRNGSGVRHPGVHNPDPGAEHIRPIRLLREYSNYLAPRFGAFSADTWTMVSIWLRNTLLNLVVLTLLLMSALVAPRLLGIVFTGTDLRWSMWCAGLALLVCTLLIGFNLQSFDDDTVTVEAESRGLGFRPRLKPSERGDSPFLIITSIVVPGMVTVFFVLSAMWRYAGDGTDVEHQWRVFTWALGAFAGGIAATAIPALLIQSGGARRFGVSRLTRLRKTLWQGFLTFATAFAAAVIAASFLTLLWAWILPVLQAESRRGVWLTLAFGPSVLLVMAMLAIVLYLGLEGRAATDERREWWSRLGAWLGIIGTAWTVIASISYFAPYGVAMIGISAGTLSLGWGTFTGVGAWLASGGKSNGENLAFDKNPISSWVIALAPFLFILGFLVIVAVLTHVVLIALSRSPYFSPGFTALQVLPFSLQRYVDTYWAFLDPQSTLVALLCVVLFGAAWLIAWRVDVNEFSMHHFYRNRLVRAYLGASRSLRHRRPNAFTGFDMDDDIKLSRFRSDDESTPEDETSDCRRGYSGPYPIINATLNMTSGDELAWRERKGQSFVFTPLYCGFDFATKQTAIAEKVSAQFGYRPTRDFASASGRNRDRVDATGSGRGVAQELAPVDTGLGIGTAVAISGAAANPNAGHHSSPAVAFLLTIFNARLGWWIGNPRHDCWTQSSPRLGLFYLLSELFGFSGVQRKYVNLSDGGHFDNMGLYELVRRRCRYIIVCDGEQDDRYSFNGLAGAIRKCRIDFGVTIELSTKFIQPPKDSNLSKCHFAVGKITYPGEKHTGSLIYVKASLTGDEPADVKEYAFRNKEFPHQTTADQFFNESQFESYRALGQHIADHTFPNWLSADPFSVARLQKHVEAIGKNAKKCQDDGKQN